MERLQKCLARAGVASRRKAEALICAGRVSVNGTIVTQLGAKIDARKDIIEVDGQRIVFDEPRVTIMLNKPAGYVTTRSDPQHRPTVLDLLPPELKRLHPVGRLDADTEGLLLLTNDGSLTYRVTHPKHEINKVYRVVVRGILQRETWHRIERGVELEDGRTSPCRVRVMRRNKEHSEVEIEIHEGRKRQVRRMFAAVGHPVVRLKRMRVGTLSLGSLPKGKFRNVTDQEVERLTALALR